MRKKLFVYFPLPPPLWLYPVSIHYSFVRLACSSPAAFSLFVFCARLPARSAARAPLASPLAPAIGLALLVAARGTFSRSTLPASISRSCGPSARPPWAPTLHSGMAAPPAGAAMTITPATLADLMSIAALTEEEKDFIKAKGLVSARHFKRSFANEGDLVRDLVEPYVSGTNIEGTDYKSSRPGLSKTCFLVLFDLVQEALAPALAQPSFAVPPAAPQAAAAPLSTASVLTPADWRAGIDNWEGKWVPKGTFKTQELLGSESVLARGRYELTVSKMHTPLLLTEIVAKRAFQVDGSFNSNRKAAPASNMDILAQALAQQLDIDTTEATGTRSSSTPFKATPFIILDCLRANAWAQRFLGNASEEIITEIQEFWSMHLRAGEMGWNVNVVFPKLYESAGWRVAFGMRAGKTYEEAWRGLVLDDTSGWFAKELKTIMGSITSKGDGKGKSSEGKDFVNSPGRRPPPRRPSPQRRRSRSRRRPSPRGRSRSKNTRIAQDRAEKERQYHRHDKAADGSDICKNFNCGRCTYDGRGEDTRSGKPECKYTHICWTCKDPSCAGAWKCTGAKQGSTPKSTPPKGGKRGRDR